MIFKPEHKLQVPDALRHVQAVRYIAPLREGGSLPGLVEGDDGFRYVVKFRGAGHGTRALIAEIIGAEIARYIGLKVPETVIVSLGEDFGRTEGDEEIQDLLGASQGNNVGIHFLKGALTWDVAASRPDALTASMIVWLDAFITNVDRTALNTNMLLWNNDLWLIDHGASLVFQHHIETWENDSVSPFRYIDRHALLNEASLIDEVDTHMHEILSDRVLRDIVNLVPDEFFRFEAGVSDALNAENAPGTDIDELRDIYTQFLINRLHNSHIFVENVKRNQAR